MSLVEILVTIFVLTVGLLAVIRILVPGLQAIPRSDAMARATQMASLVARQAESAADLRPDAILRGVRIDPADPRAGWRVYHDVGTDDVDQISLALSTPGSPPVLRPLYPNLVCGELFEAPAPLQISLVQTGPYVTGSLRVYFPDAWKQVAPGAEDDGDNARNAKTFSEVGGVLTLDRSDDLLNLRTTDVLVSYTQMGAGGLEDIVGVTAPVILGAAPTVTLNPTGAIVPYSVSVYSLAPGVSDESSDPELGRAGGIRYLDPSLLLPGQSAPPTAGSKLACMYEVVSHVRPDFDAASVTRRPVEQDLLNNSVPDIMAFDTYTPINDTTIDVDGAAWTGRIVKLPVDAVDLGSPLDATGAESVRIVSKLDGSITVPTPGAPPAGDVKGSYVRVPAGLPSGMPIRVYYRIPGNWSIERHVAANNYAVVDLTGGVPVFVPESSNGLKQCWFARTLQGANTVLTYCGSPVGTSMDFWSTATLVYPEADGHRVSVDYRYDAGGGLEKRVSGEMHLVDFSTHSFVLGHPNVLQIDAVRGASYKSRVCFDGSDRKRVRVDVDTIVMR